MLDESEENEVQTHLTGWIRLCESLNPLPISISTVENDAGIIQWS